LVVFRLTKWYMDCVAPDGTAVVTYWARLALGLLRLSGAAALVRRAAVVKQAETLRAGPPPRLEANGLAWRSRRLGIDARWCALDQPVRRTLLDSSRGKVDWDCLLPRARVRVSLPDGVTVEGLGYAECLHMTLRPWELPVRELRWGRFLSESAGVVWIEWRGPLPLTILTVNGSETDGVQIDDAGVVWRGGRVEFEPGPVLREGPLGTTTLARAPWLRFLLPRAVSQTNESKWLRQATYIADGGQSEAGWALHEVVRFARPGG
jgi:hypothetical protein